MTEYRFELRPVQTNLAADHIRQLTANSSNEYIAQVLSRLDYRHNVRQKPTIFGYLPAHIDVDLLKQIIGHRGHYLKLTTVNTGVDLIWHDRANNTFLFWSSSNYKAVRAMSLLQKRINKIEFADMPSLIDYDEQQEQAEQQQAKVPDYENGIDLC
jgi:hypothetical protein